MNGERLYHGQFAGVWYDDDGKLNIGVTNDKRIEERNPDVTYVMRDFSWNVLRDIRDAASALISQYSVIGVGLTPQYNQVRVTVESKNYVTEILEQLRWLTPNIEYAIGFEIGEIPTLASSRNPIHGGRNIIRENGNGGTITAKAICNETNRRGIITNAHVARRGIRVFNNSGFRRYIGTPAQWYFNDTVDATFIPFDDESQWEFTSSAAHMYREDEIVIPVTYQAPDRQWIEDAAETAGMQVAKFGSATHRTTGVIEAIGVGMLTRHPEDGSLHTFHDQIRHTAFAYEGDSGSPLFAIHGGQYVMIGAVISGTNSVTSVSYANKLTNVTETLNVTIVAEFPPDIPPGFTAINTFDDLNAIRHNPNGRFILMADINMPWGHDWVPIPQFNGILDGNNYTIRGMRIFTTELPAWEFAFGFIGVNNGTIRNLRKEDAILFGSSQDTGAMSLFGIIAGWNGGTITNVTIGRVGGMQILINIFERPHADVGTIVGFNMGTIEHARVINAHITASGNTGGLVGQGSGRIYRPHLTNVVISHTQTLPWTAPGLIIGGLNQSEIHYPIIENVTIQ